MTDGQLPDENEQMTDQEFIDCWTKNRENLDYKTLVGLHWDLCKELVERDEYGRLGNE